MFKFLRNRRGQNTIEYAIAAAVIAAAVVYGVNKLGPAIKTKFDTTAQSLK